MLSRKKVPVTEQDKKKPYYKYYLEELVPAAPEKYQQVLAGPLDPARALPVQERNRLFEPGFLDGELGYCVMPDGTGYIANHTVMPGVTAEMFDWWFAWHGLDNLRYTIWDNEDHYKAESMQKEKCRDATLSYQERYWDTTHAVLEDVGLGPEALYINFKHPGDMGFDVSKIGTKACSTIVCANGYGKGQPPFASPGTIMCHFIRDIEGGVELRSRFWPGYIYQDGRLIKTIPDGAAYPLMPLRALCTHNIKEFTNLAALLPRIFPEERDHF